MARKRIQMCTQKDVLYHKKPRQKKRQVARYWNGSPEEIFQDSECVAFLNWDSITDQIEHGVPQKILYEELAMENKPPVYSNFCRQVSLRSFQKLEMQIWNII